jgi:6-phosphogluconolactonase
MPTDIDKAERNKMNRPDTFNRDEGPSKPSRRKLLKNVGALALTYAAGERALARASGAGRGRLLGHVGTYNTPVDGGAGNGKGIYLFEMNAATGELTLLKLAAAARNPSWLCLDPSGRHLYSGNEIFDYNGNSGSVTAYGVNRETGDLQLLNVVSSEGTGPAYLSVRPSGKYLLVADYFGGSISVLPVLSTGALGSAVYTHRDTDPVGKTVPSTGPAGSFAFSGHDKPHAHMIDSDPSGRFVLYTDLGQDRIYLHRFDEATGKLTPVQGSPYVSLPGGDGPRHLVFHGNGKWLYSLQEEASTVVFFLFDPETGALRPQQTISTLPPGFKGTNFTSEILISNDGRFMYTANRLHDTIAVFAIRRDGRLSYQGETSTMGDYPRHLRIDPTETFLYSCNQRSDNIACFRINRTTGLLSFTGQYTGVGSPACIVFLK